jgi:hypothetical protein
MEKFIDHVKNYVNDVIDHFTLKQFGEDKWNESLTTDWNQLFNDIFKVNDQTFSFYIKTFKNLKIDVYDGSMLFMINRKFGFDHDEWGWVETNYPKFHYNLNQCKECHNVSIQQSYSLTELQTHFPYDEIEKLNMVKGIINDEFHDEDYELLIKHYLNQEIDWESLQYLNQVSWKMKLMDILLHMFGTEVIDCHSIYVNRYWDSTVGLYLNAGDTYSSTVVYNTIHKCFILTDWGSYVELIENNTMFFDE